MNIHDVYLICSIAIGFLFISGGMVIALILLHRQKHHDGLEWKDDLKNWNENEKTGY